MNSNIETQIESVNVPTPLPRFKLVVKGRTVRVTRFEMDREGRTWFEIAGADVDRDVFPTDTGFVAAGDVYMKQQYWCDWRNEWSEPAYEFIGTVEQSRLEPTGSVDNHT